MGEFAMFSSFLQAKHQNTYLVTFWDIYQNTSEYKNTLYNG